MLATYQSVRSFLEDGEATDDASPRNSSKANDTGHLKVGDGVGAKTRAR
jgi:hypothetical protein